MRSHVRAGEGRLRPFAYFHTPYCFDAGDNGQYEDTVVMLPPPEPTDKEWSSKARIDRTVLTSLFPGNASIRPTQEIQKEALDVLRSVGYISTLRLEAGEKAGKVLLDVNYALLGYRFMR